MRTRFWFMNFAFIVLVLVIAITGHVLIFLSAVFLFGINNLTAKIIIGALLFILPMAFIFSSVAAHLKENKITKRIYLFSSLWLGIALNLLFSFGAAWILTAIITVFDVDFNTVWLGLAAVLYTIFISIFSIRNASTEKIKEITVKIQNLPEAWKGKKAVQLSDVHLGHVHGKEFLQKIVNKVNRINPDIIFFTGDLFDGMDGNFDVNILPLNDLKAPWGSYFATGNHETYFGVEKVFEILRKTKVNILDDKMMEVNGVQIIGLSYPRRGRKKYFSETLENLHTDDNKPKILLWHDPTKIKRAIKAGIDLQLSGHTHQGQIFPLGILTRLIYRKYHIGLHTIGKYNLYTSSGVGTWGPLMRLRAPSEIVVIHFV